MVTGVFSEQTSEGRRKRKGGSGMGHTVPSPGSGKQDAWGIMSPWERRHFHEAERVAREPLSGST